MLRKNETKRKLYLYKERITIGAATTLSGLYHAVRLDLSPYASFPDMQRLIARIQHQGFFSFMGDSFFYGGGLIGTLMIVLGLTVLISIAFNRFTLSSKAMVGIAGVYGIVLFNTIHDLLVFNAVTNWITTGVLLIFVLFDLRRGD